MKHLALFLCLFWLVPACGLCETILWEDEAGQVVLGDDGNVQFISPDGEAADENFFVPTTVPAETPAPIEAPAQTEAPAPIEPIDFTFKGTLKYGDSGERVAQLQTRLSELGFYNAKVSGGYYKVTKAAVKAFQAHNGLSADGIAGRDTQELLFSAAAVPAEATPRPSPTPEPAKYTLMVDVVNQITRAYTYDEDGQYTVLVREMICSTGTSKYPTPCKTTVMPKKRARWGYFPTWGSHAQYLTRIDAARGEGNANLNARRRGSLLNAHHAGQNDNIGQRRFTGCLLNPLQGRQHAGRDGVYRPGFLRFQRQTRAVGAAAFIAAAEGGGRCPGHGNQLADRKAGVGNGGFQRRDILCGWGVDRRR